MPCWLEGALCVGSAVSRLAKPYLHSTTTPSTSIHLLLPPSLNCTSSRDIERVFFVRHMSALTEEAEMFYDFILIIYFLFFFPFYVVLLDYC